MDVHTAGKYQVEMHYTCGAADLGSTIELALGDRRVQAKVEKANDPPAIGAEHDRVPRSGESYVKDFAPLSLGTIELPAGQGQLTLRAVEIPGRQAAEVRGLTLTLVD